MFNLFWIFCKQMYVHHVTVLYPTQNSPPKGAPPKIGNHYSIYFCSIQNFLELIMKSYLQTEVNRGIHISLLEDLICKIPRIIKRKQSIIKIAATPCHRHQAINQRDVTMRVTNTLYTTPASKSFHCAHPRSNKAQFSAPYQSFHIILHD